MGKLAGGVFLPKSLISGPSDFSLAPIGNDPPLPQHHFHDAPVSTKRGAAAILARMRQPNDVWLTVSDNEKVMSSIKLDPVGSDIVTAGVSVMFNGQKLTSSSHFDIYARVELNRGENIVTVHGSDRPLWLRLLRITRASADHELVHLEKLEPGQNTVRIFSRDGRRQGRTRFIDGWQNGRALLRACRGWPLSVLPRTLKRRSVNAMSDST